MPPNVNTVANMHVHMIGNGVSSGFPSTPGNSILGQGGDTGYAAANSVDVYVISQYGLALGEATAPLDGSASRYLVKGDNFTDWYKALKRDCSKY